MCAWHAMTQCAAGPSPQKMNRTTVQSSESVESEQVWLAASAATHCSCYVPEVDQMVGIGLWIVGV